MKILIADDDPVSREMLQTQLERWGHEVVVAIGGDQAWEALSRDAFPVVISDWLMPGCDGLELVRRIRARAPGPYVYVVLLTVKTEKSDRVAAMHAGADEFLTKPFDPQELQSRLWTGERILALQQQLARQNRELAASHEELERANQLLEQRVAARTQELERATAELQQFVHVASHDMQEPLRLIQILGDLLVQRFQVGLTAEGRDCVERIRRQAGRMRRLIGALREYSDVCTTVPRLRPVDLGDVVRVAAERLRDDIAAVGARLDVATPLPVASADRSLMERVLINLLENAVQFRRDDVPLVVTIRGTIVPGKSPVCELSVSDNGRGIDAGQLSRLFVPCVRVHSADESPGPGMGLAICRKIVERHGGTIAALSPGGAGVTIRLTLPTPPEA